VAYLSTSANIYAITRGHALLGIFIILEGIKLSLGILTEWPPFPSSLLSCLIFSALISHLSDPITVLCRLAKQRMLLVTYDRYWWSFDWTSGRVECLHAARADW